MLSLDQMVQRLTEASEKLTKGMKYASHIIEKMPTHDKRSRRAEGAHDDLQDTLMNAELLADELKLIRKFKKNRDHQPLDRMMYDAMTLKLNEVLQELSETSKLAKMHSTK